MLIEAEIWTVARTDKGNAVLVKPIEGDRAVPIIIGQLEAQSILIGLGSVPMPRPLTHDLFITTFDKLGLQIERVDITELKDGTFYARIIVHKGSELFTLDARPSDALGIAARSHCSVYIDDGLVEEAGIPVNLITDDESAPTTPDNADTRDTELIRLEEELSKAIDDENYEEAARLRDRIKDLS
ncbi:MAG: bifunctional nuclease domain-containing protein [Spirochaetaceae bacterium]